MKHTMLAAITLILVLSCNGCGGGSSGGFGAGGFASCETPKYPDGWTQGEFTLNPTATSQEAVDIQLVGSPPCPNLTASPTCQTSRICTVYRDDAPGGTVEFQIGEVL